MSNDLERAAKVCEEYADTIDDFGGMTGNVARTCAKRIRSLSPAQPEGWVSVPPECPLWARKHLEGKTGVAFIEGWEDMLKAAAQAGTVEELTDRAQVTSQESGRDTEPAPAAPAGEPADTLPEEPSPPYSGMCDGGQAAHKKEWMEYSKTIRSAYGRLQAELAEARDALSSLLHQRDELRTKLEAAERELADVQTEFDRQRVIWSNALATAERELAEVRSAFFAVNSDNESLMRQVEAAERELAEAREQLRMAVDGHELATRAHEAAERMVAEQAVMLKDTYEALDSLWAAIGDRLLANGPLDQAYAHRVLRDINDAKARIYVALAKERT